MFNSGWNFIADKLRRLINSQGQEERLVEPILVEKNKHKQRQNLKQITEANIMSGHSEEGNKSKDLNQMELRIPRF
ncbi:hypothetical protein KY290_007543 [Solanum tuberosum]|uniref:Uncharacterized protein n=1 Tax=Solanum tuberosum TaxID=4113 RepID=A0ABQ7W8J8_SOLTU|nr:hypothetical protein KY290_007543 [Solanum tuberosum]